MEQGHLATLPCFGRELDRFAEVVETTGIAEVGAGQPADAEGCARARGRARRRAPAPGRRARSHPRIARVAHRRATSVSAPTSSGEGPSGSSSASASLGNSDHRGSPRRTATLAERAHRAGGGRQVAGRTEGRDRLLQGLGRLGESTGLEGGLAEAGERLGSFGMPGRSERERALEVRERRGGVQTERALSRERQEPQGRRLELGRPARSAPAARASSSAVA